MSYTASGIIGTNFQLYNQTFLLQIRRICENDCIGFDVTNNGRETLVFKDKDTKNLSHKDTETFNLD